MRHKNRGRRNLRESYQYNDILNWEEFNEVVDESVGVQVLHVFGENGSSIELDDNYVSFKKKETKYGFILMIGNGLNVVINEDDFNRATKSMQRGRYAVEVEGRGSEVTIFLDFI